jgi:hypothetical protein
MCLYKKPSSILVTSKTYTREIFDIHTIVISSYEHSLQVHNTLTIDVSHWDVLVQQVL